MEDVITELNLDTSDINYQIQQMNLAENLYSRFNNDDEYMGKNLEYMRKYLLKKLEGYHFRLGLNEDSSLFEIMEVIDKNQLVNRMEGLSHIIHYLLHLFEIKQMRTVVWLIENELGPEDAYAVFDHGMLDEFTTGYDLDFSASFKMLYNLLISGIGYQGQIKVNVKEYKRV